MRKPRGAQYTSDPRAVTAAIDSLPERVKVTMATNHLTRLALKAVNPVKAKAYLTNRLTQNAFGRLSLFVDLPKEIFLEIAGYLLPADLLSLSRVSRDFRSLFLSRKARSVWGLAIQNAMEELSLPIGCPPDLNEPQYSSLIFDQLCFACNSVRASKVYFTLRLRFCSRCLKENIQQGRKFQRASWMEEDNISILSYLPHSFNSQYFSIRWNGYCIAEYEHVAQEYFKLRHDEEALQQYIQDRQKMVSVIMQHGLLVQDWYDARIKMDDARRLQLRTTKMASIPPPMRTRRAQKAALVDSPTHLV